MSLQVWLPFVKDLYNQGVNDLEPSISSTQGSIITGGKLGRCFKTTTSGNIILNYSPDINTGSLSFGGWFKFNKAEIQTALSTKTYTSSAPAATGNLLGNDSYGGVGLIWGSNNMYSSGKELTAITIFSHIRTATVNASTSSFSITFDEWVNIYFVWDYSDRTLKFYVNGSLFNTKTFADFTDAKVESLMCNRQSIYAGSGPSASIPFFANDIRVYDHALSSKEVKELSKGLVCHYTLGDRSIQQMNNCYSYPTFNTSSASGGWSHWGGSGHIGTYGQNTDKAFIYNKSNTYSHWVANGSGATYNYLVYQSPAFEGGTRSLCCIIKHENGLPITNSICYPTWNARSGGTPINAWTSIISLSNGFYLCKCENIQQDGSNDLVGVYVTAGNKIYISEGYLENDRVCCSDIFYNDTTVYDSSGYNYHGTINTAQTISSTTARYSVSTNFNGTDNAIKIPFNAMLGLTAAGKTDYTISVWTYKTTIGSKGYQTILGGPGGFELEARNAAETNPVYVAWNWGKNTGTYEFNKWCLFTFVHTTTGNKIYVNGELASSGSAANVPIGDFFIGSWRDVSSQNYQGNMSDFRIYATALSADDVKELYQTSASIDKSGNMYAYEFNEV